MQRLFLFDRKNPWAFIYELSSTHPLTGKRIERLSKISKESGVEPLFDFDEIGTIPIDKGKLWGNFLKDILVLTIPMILMITPFLFLVGTFLGIISLSFGLFLSAVLFAMGIGSIIVTLYRYPGGEFEATRVIDVMGDVYASPVRGRKVRLSGEIIGRGQAGYIFSEDFMIKDETGLMYLNYESWFPLLGNLLFAVSKVENLIGQKVEAEGWFLRGLFPYVGLNYLTTPSERIKSYVKLGALIGAGLLIFFGVISLAVLSV